MLISSIFPESANEEPTIEDAIGDLRLDNENSVEAYELCETMKTSAKYKWLKRLEKNPNRVVSVGDDVVGPWYDKVIAHRKRWERVFLRLNTHSINQEEFLGTKHRIPYQSKE